MKITHLLVFHEEELFTENSQREFLSIAGWSSPVARQAHNLKVVGSNPTPATKIFIIKINQLQDKAVSKEPAFFAFFNRFSTKSVVKGVYFFNKKRWTVTFLLHYLS